MELRCGKEHVNTRHCHPGITKAFYNSVKEIVSLSSVLEFGAEFRVQYKVRI